jgi:hypothetical protein
MPKIAETVGGGAPTPAAPVIPAPSKPAADAKSLMPMPNTKDALVVGKSYNTSRGPAKWDGKQFIPI